MAADTPANSNNAKREPSARPHLVADIGGTNARFAIADANGGLQDVQIVPTQQLGDGAPLADLLAQRYDLRAMAGACFALAGPVNNGLGKITNGSLALAQSQMRTALNMPVLLVNDFYALAHAVPYFSELHALGDATLEDSERTQLTRAVIGPGSGLGMSLCLPDAADPLGWRVLASEGGYGDLATSSPLEAEVLALLQQQGHVCWETVLSGPGLVLLYRTLATLWGDTAAADAAQSTGSQPPVTAAWITEQARDAKVPLCHQTLELFFSFLGAAAGNLALTGYALGGVYIAGGIVPRMIDLAQQSPMRRRFDERGALTGLVQKVPLYLVADTHPGLLGAAITSRRLWQ